MISCTQCTVADKYWLWLTAKAARRGLGLKNNLYKTRKKKKSKRQEQKWVHKDEKEPEVNEWETHHLQPRLQRSPIYSEAGGGEAQQWPLRRDKQGWQVAEEGTSPMRCAKSDPPCFQDNTYAHYTRHNADPYCEYKQHAHQQWVLEAVLFFVFSQVLFKQKGICTGCDVITFVMSGRQKGKSLFFPLTIRTPTMIVHENDHNL